MLLRFPKVCRLKVLSSCVQKRNFSTHGGSIRELADAFQTRAQSTSAVPALNKDIDRDLHSDFFDQHTENQRVIAEWSKSFPLPHRQHLQVDYSTISKELVTTMKRIITEKTIEKVTDPGYVGRRMNYPELLRRQLHVEEERQSEAVSSYQEIFQNLIRMGRGTSVKSVQRTLLQWYEPLLGAITEEIAAIEALEFAMDRQVYGPYFLMLPAEKMAVITLDTALNCILRTGNVGEKITRISVEIADIMEAEVNIMKMKAGKKSMPFWKRVQIDSESSNSKQNSSARTINRNIRRIANESEWPTPMKVKVGVKLLDLLLQSAKHSESAAPKVSFIYTNNFHKNQRRQGFIRLDAEVYNRIVNKNFARMLPRFFPMLVPSKRWNNKQFYGAFYRLKAPLMKTIVPSQAVAVKRADMDKVLEALDYLGQVGWKINTKVLDVVTAAVEQRLEIGEIPSSENLPMPTEESCFRVPSQHLQQNRNSQFQSTTEPQSDLFVNSAVAMLPQYEAAVNEEEVLEEVPEFDAKYFQQIVGKINKKNAELHSLRCDMKIKLSIAELFREDAIFFPHNLDFRGRAYPVPPNLNHMGPDMCRALLIFDKAKPLGASGLRWLKIHLANLCGYNKVSMDNRVAWVDSLMSDVRDSAEKPLEGDRWWTEQENPFQALACCTEIIAAVDSGYPEEYMCSLPVHQDGSCNGLQHYAALGRDQAGGQAVNLVIADKPQDVYSRVLDGVTAKIAEDCKLSEDLSDESLVKRGKLARLVQGVVDRRVIKQTVMTSVYGVTALGARGQVQARLLEKLHTDNSLIISAEREHEIFQAASYVAGLTLASLGEMFHSAKEIMDWLGTCALLVAKEAKPMCWVTPLGLPVIQPYRKRQQHTVRTVLQAVVLSMTEEFLPVSAQKQRSAFPPNFVHSLDSTHMLMTCLKMKEQKLIYAAVHDSFWTHATDVPTMNQAIRDAFVELYESPVLEELRESLVMRYPDIIFPPVPQRGTLDIKNVHSSEYFFH